MRVLSERDILFGSIITILISAMVGVIGMMGMYSAFPNISGITVPTCDCIKIHEDYEHGRNLFSIIGWFFGLIPVMTWQLYTHLSFRYEEKLKPNNGATD